MKSVFCPICVSLCLFRIQPFSVCALILQKNILLNLNVLAMKLKNFLKKAICSVPIVVVRSILLLCIYLSLGLVARAATQQRKITVSGIVTDKDNLRHRKRYAPQILSEIKRELLRIKSKPDLLPKSEMAGAVDYMLSQWEAIKGIFTEGYYYLDNNLVERYNRYISLSRRNSLFFGSHKGAERGALFYSLACSCRMQGINTFEYITEVINKAAKLPPNTDIKVYRNLLPDKWKENRSRIET